MFLNQESILMGTTTQLVIRPQLLVNGRTADVSLVKNISLVISTDNYIESIPVTKNFTNLQFNHDHELTVDFQIPANLSSIKAKLTCDLINATSKATEKFSAA